MFTWDSRGPDKKKECTKYGKPLIRMSALVAEGGVRNIVTVIGESLAVKNVSKTANDSRNSTTVDQEQ